MSGLQMGLSLPNQRVIEAPALSLRPYQLEAIEAAESAYQSGIIRPLVALPTGTGKTVIFSRLATKREGRALILAHRDELVQQAADKLRWVAPGVEVGIVKAELNQVNADIVVGSVQTLSRPKRLEQLGTDFTTVIVDEAHHATAESYIRILQHVGSFDEFTGPLTLGVTATPERADGTPLGAVFDQIVYRKTILEMIAAGYLCDIRAKQVGLTMDLSRVKTRGGDYQDGALAETLMAAKAPQHIADAYARFAEGRKAIVFTPTVAVAHAIAAELKGRGYAAEGLDGTTPQDERRAILKRFTSGETMILCNCAVLTEGFDEPSVDCIIMARPTKSKPLFIQCVGRGTRLHPGKDDCLVIDVVGATRHHDLVTTASLFGADADALGEMTLTELLERAAKARAEREREGRQKLKGQATLGGDYDEVMDFPDGVLVSLDAELFRRSKLHWVESGDDYTLNTGNGQIVLSRNGEMFEAYLRERGAEPVLLASAMSLEFAQGIAEDKVRELGAEKLVDRSAAWRTYPASQKQLDVLKRAGIVITGELSKGEASDMISQLTAQWGRRR